MEEICKEKSYFFNTVRTVGTGIGEVAGIVGLSLATFGLGSPSFIWYYIC